MIRLNDGGLSLRAWFDSVYVPWHLGLSKGAADQYRYAINSLEKISGRPVAVGDLSEDLLVPYLASLAAGLSPASVNKKAKTLQTLWRFAHKKGHATEAPADLPLMRIPKRIPSAWSLEELERLLAACRSAAPLPGWDGRHWVALVLTAYDSLHRISCLLSIKVSQFDAAGGLLSVTAEQTKQLADISHRLHPQTVAALIATLERPRTFLFPWPLGKREIWRQYGKILEAAGLPSDRRSKFHRIRRTAYTLVYSALGQQAATQQAGHSCNLASRYLDVTKLPAKGASDVLPRPNLGSSPPIIPPDLPPG